MRWALSVSDGTFLGLKLALTAFGAAYLAVHQNFPFGRWAMRFVFFVYFSLMIYHGYVVYLRG
jgi:hypothetical protein